MESSIKIVLDPASAKFNKVEIVVSCKDKEKQAQYFDVCQAITDEIEKFSARAEGKIRLEKAIGVMGKN